MSRRINNLVTININGVEITCTQEQAVAIATACGNTVSAAPQTSKKSAPSTTNTKSSVKKTSAPATTKSSKMNLADFEPKKDKDGQYNYKSWKTCRRNYVAQKLGKDLTKEWVDYADFCKAAEAFDKKYAYIKKADR